MAPRTPVSIIGGFLGAGKTTLLNHLLRTHPGQRVALLINDFGAVNIDAALITSRDADTIALTNGCVCCSLGDDLSQALMGIIAADPPFDSVIVEASGVSDPGRMAQLVRAAPELQLDAITVVVDAEVISALLQDVRLRDTVVAQLTSADLLVLNKTDLVAPDRLQAVRHSLQQWVPDAALIEAQRGQVPWKLVIQPSGQPQGDGCGEGCANGACSHGQPTHHSPTGDHHTQLFETWSTSTRHIKPLAQWRAALERLQGSVLRLKGIVRSREHGWSEIQIAGRRMQLAPAAQPPASALGSIVAVALQGHLPRARLNALCDQLSDCAPAAATSQSRSQPTATGSSASSGVTSQ